MYEWKQFPMPTKDERIMAALSHLGVNIPGTGLIITVIIWATQKEKSRFVAFQSLQALAFQVFGMLYHTVFFFGFIILGVFLDQHGAAGFREGLIFLAFAIMALIFLGGLLMTIYGDIAAIGVYEGHPFHYAFLGNWIEKKQDRDR